MVRESAVLALLGFLASGPGCSFILDFSDQAGVHDASLDGPYTQAECDYKEPNDTLETAAIIDPLVDTGPAAICKNAGGEDDDYYRFSVPAKVAKTTIKLMFTDSNVRDLDLKLFDSTGAQTAQSRSFSDGETLICPAVSPPCPMLANGADYTLEVLPGSPVNLNNYTFSVEFE